MAFFINEDLIHELLRKNENPDRLKVLETVEKARRLEGLSLDDTAVLLQAEASDLVDEVFHAAKDVKHGIYGNRIVLFAPLYISNECTNNCLYCAFRKDNKELQRKTLTLDEIKREVEVLVQQGHKRLLLLYGEKYPIDYICKSVEVVYSTKVGNGEIRRANVNIAPLSVSDFKTLKSTGIGTYQCFQETYHLETYTKMHPSGRKSVYEWRLFSQDRAQQAGIDDVALGVLYGLYDWKFETLALLMHAAHLEKTFGVGPHTISFPRIEPALGSDISNQPPYLVSDIDFKRIIAILRMAAPYTGLILSTRETPEMRREALELGVSQISAGSRTHPGGYSDNRDHAPDVEQFTLGDTRPLDEVIRDIAELGHIPSFCTACYRLGRTGGDFMELAKPGLIQKFCQPNAILTFKEYLTDYASDKTIEIADRTIIQQLELVPAGSVRSKTVERLERIRHGERDLYF